MIEGLEPHVVVIGGGLGGVMLCIQLRDSYGSKLRLTMVSPSEYFCFLPATVRMPVDPTYVTKGTALLSDIFAKDSNTRLPSGRIAFEFVHGEVVDVNVASQSLTIRKVEDPCAVVEDDGKKPDVDSKLSYDVLVVASGCRQPSDLYGFNGHQSIFFRAQAEMNDRLRLAKTVALIGGGPTGVETSAEIAEKLPQVKVDLYCGSHLPVERVFGEARSRILVDRLTKMGVNCIIGYAKRDGERRVISPEDGKMKEYDVVIDTSGAKPRTEFFAKEYRDAQGYLKTDSQLMVAPHVYALGDVVSGSNKTVPCLHTQLPIVVKKIVTDTGVRVFSKIPDFNPAASAQTLGVTLGTKSSVGVVKGYSVPAFLINFVKGRDLLVSHVAELKQRGGK